MKHINSMIVLVLGLLMLSVATSTGAFAAAPTISNANVQLRTLAPVGIPGGEVAVSVSATVEDSDGIAGLRVTVERAGVFPPFPMQPGLYLSPGDSPFRDGFSVTIGPEFIPDAQRAGDYLITASDGVTTVSTIVTLPGGLAALAAGGQTVVNTSTGLLQPTISIPPIPGANRYRILIQNDSDSTTTTFDGVEGANLSSTPSIQVPLEREKFYRLSIDAFDGITVASSNLRSESDDICYSTATGTIGKIDIPCITQKDVHLITESDDRVVMQAIGRVLVLTEQDLDYLKTPPLTDPPTVPVTVTRGSFGPFRLTGSILETVGAGADSRVTDQFASARNPLDETQIPVNQRAGDYTFRAQDQGGDVVTVSRNFPSGLAPLPAAGPVTINTCSEQCKFTPEVSIDPVPGASNYRVVVFNDSDSTRINFSDLPGGTLAESPSVELFPDVLEPGKFYRIHMDAFNAQTFSSSTVRSRSNSLVYDPSGLDPDKDGIQDSIDLSPNSFSNDFSNGKEFGTISGRGGLRVVVVESQDPADPEGLRLGAASDPDATPGTGVAIIDSPCALLTTKIQLTERDAKKLKCGSLISEILDGTVEFLLGADSVVIAPAGAILTIREPFPGQYSVENSLESFVPITLLKDGEEIPVQPGAAGVSLPIVQIKPGDGPNCVNPKSKGLVPVAILGGAVNVTTIVQSSLEIDDDANAATAGARAAMTAIKDVNGDGVNDLIMQFKTEDLNAAGLLSDRRTLYLIARLSDGALLVGSDVIFVSNGPTCQ